ncbi:MAG TPA: MarR family transcriptional regulator [Candidatus Nanoarchaeia archaeon]|nr:MarR family transcriptional regulator [Candidatus Nanoarchaeia archaeon]
MENKYVGYLLICVSLLVVLVILLFNSALKDIVSTSCGEEHSIVCPMNKTIDQQTYLALGLVVLIVVIGLMLILSKPHIEIQKETIFKTKLVEKKPEPKIIDISDLKSEEKQIFEFIQSNKAVFQADLIEKTGLGKAKMSRIIDRLEGRGLVERKRRGLTNVVVLKE